ncbi:hypothetical protein HanXRQr2_Chr04g0145691 [Helianthus annuus]|uniref:Uncharacterized protein n=1 Tax=Helianthus annuus TaxID=4232 RepID=A0A9K3J5T9_HELAN|nr:hypothetical protein HanXRQr2_Chr04g0145691 [Helianthus annuus]KAJ0579642.1 hypothetical protein HanHA300_Chr04g0120181 [Helianthus annuus]KAJ0595538.1 hypothetical protein HanHA89_Chr04g0132451 [Helianthus annuus]KAJ0929708.1 hypothetical protein HanPSC8_Chr04g0140761 [Helianthus annuus]
MNQHQQGLIVQLANHLLTSIHRSSLRNRSEEISISLQLSEPELKRRKQSDEEA